MKRYLPFLILILVPVAARADAPVPKFEDTVRPILKAHCFECHGEGKKAKGDLDVRLKRLLVQGGDSGAAIMPGKADKSLLIERLRSGQMPPGKKKLTAEEIARIAAWIDAGALTARPEPATLGAGFQLSEDEKNFWAFQPIASPTPPNVKGKDRVRTPIDAFLLAKLEGKGLSFAPDAERRTLIRRATFDLLGLPPTPGEVEAFVKDANPAAYENLLDRLLASQHYGERWGRHWLDVAGYADSEGYTGDDIVRPSAFRYRDYVIRAFNADMPFDRFLHEQLAGDELVAPPHAKLSPDQLDKLIATGFLRMAPDGTDGKDVNVKEASNQAVADTLQIVGTSLLGLTMHCAQCHNHRYDPIPQVDYYQFRAVFEPAFNTAAWRTPRAREVKFFSSEGRGKLEEMEAEAKKLDQKRLERIKVAIQTVFDATFAKVPSDQKDAVRQALKASAGARTPEQKALLAKYKGLLADATNITMFDSAAARDIAALNLQAQKLRAAKAATDSIRALTEIPGTVPATFLLHRGDFEQPREEVKPAHLTILAPFQLPELPAKDPQLATTGRRLAFARSLTHPQHPLTSRVLVNRFWMHHFGTGIVTTPGDFGFLGERPTHPELLDWLARDFQASGWKLKRFHKQLMLSTAYRQASTGSADARAADPDNKLLARMPVRRLEAEVLRDAMLSVGGKLNVKMFGPPIPIKPDLTGQIVIGVDTNDGAGRPTGKVVPLNGEEFRRSMYVQVRRSKPLGLLETFDGPILNPNCERRNVTTVTPQALLLMNSKDVIDHAEVFARRLKAEAGSDTHRLVTLAWHYAWSQEPTAADVAAAETFLADQTRFFQKRASEPAAPARVSDPSLAALTNFCQAMLTANAFLYVD